MSKDEGAIWGGFLFGAIIGAIGMGLLMQSAGPKTETDYVYTFEDGTVVHNCKMSSYSCGDTLFDCTDGGDTTFKTRYECRRNYKVEEVKKTLKCDYEER